MIGKFIALSVYREDPGAGNSASGEGRLDEWSHRLLNIILSPFTNNKADSGTTVHERHSRDLLDEPAGCRTRVL